MAATLDSSNSMDSTPAGFRPFGVNVNRMDRPFGPVNLAVTPPKMTLVRVVSRSRARFNVNPSADFDDRLTVASPFAGNDDAVSYRLNRRGWLHFFLNVVTVRVLHDLKLRGVRRPWTTAGATKSR
jgi:hypothetical protein